MLSRRRPWLGRRADHGDLGEAQEIEAGARVQQAERPVDVIGISGQGQVETLRQDDLEDVPGLDVLLGGLMEARYWSEVTVRSASALGRPGNGAATSSPLPARTQSLASPRRREHACSYASAAAPGSSGTTTLSTRTMR